MTRLPDGPERPLDEALRRLDRPTIGRRAWALEEIDHWCNADREPTPG